jgi:hypothetical protein
MAEHSNRRVVSLSLAWALLGCSVFWAACDVETIIGREGFTPLVLHDSGPFDFDGGRLPDSGFPRDGGQFDAGDFDAGRFDAGLGEDAGSSLCAQPCGSAADCLPTETCSLLAACGFQTCHLPDGGR